MAAFTITLPGPITVNFFEAAEGSQDAAISSKQQIYKTIWKVRWADVENAKVALLGRATARPAGFAFPGSPAFFSRQLPHAHPNAPWLSCAEITKTEGRGPRGKDADGVAKYEWGFLFCLYTNLGGAAVLSDAEVQDPTTLVPNEALLNRFVRKRRKPAARFMETRTGSWLWQDTYLAGTPRAVTQAIPLRIPQVRVQWIWMGVPIANLNEAAINDTIGKTNLTAFGGFNQMTLLLNAADWPDYEPIPGRAGFKVDVLFDVTYYGTVNTVFSGPNVFPDPLRANRFFPIANVRAPGPPAVFDYPFPPIEWADMFKPINT